VQMIVFGVPKIASADLDERMSLSLGLQTMRLVPFFLICTGAFCMVKMVEYRCILHGQHGLHGRNAQGILLKRVVQGDGAGNFKAMAMPPEDSQFYDDEQFLNRQEL